MQYELRYSNQFKKQYKKLLRSGRKNIIDELEETVGLLAKKIVLPVKYRNHKLTGNLRGFCECHVAPDLLLIYRICEDVLVLVLELVAMGSHGVLFG